MKLIRLYCFTFFFSFILSQKAINDSRENAITTAIETVSPAVASINVTQIQRYSISPFQRDPWFDYFFPPELREREAKALGSGIVISPDGYLITNDHVVEHASKVIVTLPGGKEYDAEIVGVDGLRYGLGCSDQGSVKYQGCSWQPVNRVWIGNRPCWNRG